VGESPAVAACSLTKVIFVRRLEKVSPVVMRRDTSRHWTTSRAAALPGIRVPGTGA